MRKYSSYQRELLAGNWSIDHFFYNPISSGVRELQIQTDNSPVVANVQKRTGATSLNSILLSILQKVQDNNLRIKTIYIRGIQCITADRLSKVMDGADFMLNHNPYIRICQIVNIRPQVDGFATKWNRQTRNYVSWVQEEETESTNSSYQIWIDNRIWWLFPPISILPQVVSKMIQEKLSAILTTPDCKTLSVLAELHPLNKRCVMLPKISQYYLKGQRMSAANGSHPPGRLLDQRIQEFYQPFLVLLGQHIRHSLNSGDLADCKTYRFSNGEKKSSILNMRSAVSTVIGLATRRRSNAAFSQYIFHAKVATLQIAKHALKFEEMLRITIGSIQLYDMGKTNSFYTRLNTEDYM
ncbi:MAG: hypothetical protein EZS28_011589 [Streblomastix strix]|uniref:Uncharacterized protein n=1 Tax=Streblomastix strix TaxID=222440 RepID=A0A5J4WDW1_9EUKA|nr:MAG: hypothetical protein EZS28_011589 [Streblomastix strix]